ncbi:hypothetical protein V5N11_007209 [Cardamine amara subsp. amara]|uniref:Uncharacterized protein n=1 Tax=Cardamine amara subsp. amara TaxID=228776 RepID=A0ABD0ZZI3_CARAN
MVTGRPKIAKDVLDVMRNYLSVQDPSEKQARIERVRRSVWDLEGDTQGQKILLRFESPTIVSHNVDKDKGLVFDFQVTNEKWNGGVKFMAEAIKAGAGQKSLEYVSTRAGTKSSQLVTGTNSTVFRAGQGLASSSGIRNTIIKKRNRPSKWKRQAQPATKTMVIYKEKQKVFNEEGVTPKRKASEEVNEETETVSTVAKQQKDKVVPHEEPPGAEPANNLSGCKILQNLDLNPLPQGLMGA